MQLINSEFKINFQEKYLNHTTSVYFEMNVDKILRAGTENHIEYFNRLWKYGQAKISEQFYPRIVSIKSSELEW